MNYSVFTKGHSLKMPREHFNLIKKKQKKMTLDSEEFPI